MSAFEERKFASIAGVQIDSLSFAEVVDEIVGRATAGLAPGYVVPTNAQCVLLFQEDALLRDIYRGAFLVVPDGVPLTWVAPILGSRLRGRVNGTDLFETLCAEAARRGLRVFLLGGREGAAAKSASLLKARNPGLQVCGITCPPPGFERDRVENEKVLAAISAARPHLLFVGLGAPKQEYWIYEHSEKLGVPVSIAVGGTFDLVAGLVPRAPRWMQRAGLEWLHRLRAEPRRLWKRYVVGNTQFCFLILKQYVIVRLGKEW